MLLVYGFFAYGSAPASKLFVGPETLVTVCLVSCLISLQKIIGSNRYESFNQKVSISIKEAIWTLGLFIFILMINATWLKRSLTGDELAYAGIANKYSLEVFNFLAFISSESSSALILQLVSLGILAVLGISSIYFLKLNFPTQIYVAVVVILIFQAGVGLFGGAGIGYSKLNTFPYFVSTGLFGFNEISYRATTAMLTSVLMLVVFKFLVSLEISKWSATLICLAIVTTPLIAHHSVIIEQSVFFFLFAIIPLLEVASRARYTPERLVPVLIIGTYFRFTVLIVLVLYILYGWFSSKENRTRLIRVAPLLLLLLPYLLGLLLSPSAATSVSYFGFFKSNPTDYSRLDVLSSALLLSADSVTIPVCIIGALYWASKSRISFILAVLFLAISWTVFYEFTSTQLIGYPKYQEEWLSPLLVLGLTYLAIFLKRSIVLNKNLAPIFFIIIIFANYLSYKELPLRNTSFYSSSETYSDARPFAIKERDTRFAISTIPTPIQPALAKVNDIGQAGKCFLAGAVYNVIPEIMAGWTVGELKSAIKVRELVIGKQTSVGDNWTSINSKTLSAADVECVVLSQLPNIDEVEKELLASNWVKVVSIKDSEYSTAKSSIWVVNKN